MQQEIGIGLALEAADAPADLVELGQPEAVGPLDDQGVAVGDVDAGLDDRRADEHIGLAGDEAGHDFFELAFLHLPVADGDAEPRVHLFDLAGHALNRRHPVVQVEDLPPAVGLGLDGAFDQCFVVAADDRLDRAAIHGRCLDHAHGARASHREVEGAGDRGGAHREDIDIRAQALDRLLLLHAEALFLVDHQQAEILKVHVAAEQPVGADDDVDFALGELGDELPVLAIGAEAADHLDDDRVGGHALAEGVEVLLAEDGGGHEDGDLLAREDGFEGGANGHLRLAKADVATNQAVHRLGLFHILLRLLDRAELIGCFLKGEGGFEVPLPGVIGREGVAAPLLPPGVQAEHLGGVVEGGALGSAAGLLPVAAPDFPELRLCLVEPDVARQQVRFVERHMDRHLLGEFDGDHLFAPALNVDLREAPEEADPMLQVDERVAVGQLGEVEQLVDLRDRGPRPLAARAQLALGGVRKTRCR